MAHRSKNNSLQMMTWVVKENYIGKRDFCPQEIKMTIADIRFRWNEFFQNILNRKSKRYSIQLARGDLARERSIRLLQNRYGYSKEQAKSELSKHYSKAKLY